MDAEIRYVICIDNDGYRASLEPLKLYMALPDGEPELGLIRVVDESGEDYLYPATAFVEVALPQPEAKTLYELLQVEAGKSAEAPPDTLPDAIRPWLAEAEEFIEENEEVLSDPELDSITNSHLATDATTRLTEVSSAMRRVRTIKGFPSRQLLQITKAHRRLLSFSQRVLRHYEEKFAEGEEHQRSENAAGSYSAVEEAERIIQDQG
jgi:hypothetical protein